MTTVNLQFQIYYYGRIVETIQENVKIIFRLVLGFLNKVPSKIKGYFRGWIKEMDVFFRSNTWAVPVIFEQFPIVRAREMTEDLAIRIADFIYEEELSFDLDEFLLFLEYSYQLIHSPSLLEIFDFQLVIKMENTLSFLEGDLIDKVKCRDLIRKFKVFFGLRALYNVYSTFPGTKHYAIYQEETEDVLSAYEHDIDLFLGEAEVLLMEIENYNLEKEKGYYSMVKKYYTVVVQTIMI